MPSTFHIGQKIKEVWKRSGLKGTEFAERLHRQRQSIYPLFRQESMDTRLLEKISRVLNHDFFLDYSKHLAGAPVGKAKPNKPVARLSRSIDQLSKNVGSLARSKHRKGL